jgi:hypothetical protein
MWRGGRAVDCTGLENRRPFTGLVSSNLTLSATFFFFLFGHLSCEGPAPEAEYFAQRGLTDIQYAVCISPDKLPRAADILQRAPWFQFFYR